MGVTIPLTTILQFIYVYNLFVVYFLCLLWENRAVDLSPPTRSVSCSSNSFATGGETHLLPPSFYSYAFYIPLQFKYLYILLGFGGLSQFRVLICGYIHVYIAVYGKEVIARSQWQLRVFVAVNQTELKRLGRQSQSSK